MHPSVEVEMQADDWKAFVRFIRARNKNQWRKSVVFYVVWGAISTGIPLVLAPIFFRQGVSDWLSLTWFTVFVLACSRSVWERCMTWVFRSVPGVPPDTQAVNQHVRYEVRPEGFFAENRISRTEFPWLTTLEIVETPTHIFIIHFNTTGNIIPKRCFATPLAISAFVTVARENQQQTATATATATATVFSNETAALTP